MRKRLLILPLALLAGTASVATAQVVNNDHDRGPVAGQLIDHPCGPEQQSVVRTQSAVGSTNSTAPDPLPGRDDDRQRAGRSDALRPGPVHG